MTTQIVESVLVPALPETPDWVIGYAPFGMFVAHAAAQAIGARCAYGDPTTGYATYFDISASDSVLVVADDIYSGGSVLKTVEQIERRGARVISIVFCLANLSGKQHLGTQEIVSAAELAANRYPAETCPLCAEGSVALAPRPNWRALIHSTAD